MSISLSAKMEVSVYGWNELEREDKRLLAEAAGARRNASAPYSNYRVGAAILWRSGNISVGCNVENCIYNVLHAEKCAIGSGIATWGVDRIERMAVIGAHNKSINVEPPFLSRNDPKFNEVASGVRIRQDAAVSCGQCLQDVLEFSYGENIALLQPSRGVVLKTTLHDLLPAHFGPHDLGIDYNKLNRIDWNQVKK